MSRLIWYLTFGIGAFGAINAFSEARIDVALLWLTWIGFFASMEFGARP